jgi:hypothetical protein
MPINNSLGGYMQKIDPTQKLYKYIILARERITHNEAGDDIRKLLTEIFVLKPNTQIRGGWREYERFYYREYKKDGANDVDVGLEEGQSYVSVSGNVDDFIELNFPNTTLETNNIRAIRTYKNLKFLKRNRETSFDEIRNYAVDKNGNVYTDEGGEV